ncbi:MAG: TatD family hydrolase [Oscillospiraceae bacterium]|nr:TatD family hydrolase [Oscillospiraceae bacterium]
MRLIFDTHAHYDDEAFDSDREALLRTLPEKGICNVVNVGAELKGCYDSVTLAEEHSYIYAAVGIHPGCIQGLPDDYLQQVESLLSHPKVVAVGEIGLDYHFDDNAPKEVQKEVFAAQLQLAKDHDLPVIIHDREAHGDTMELLRKYKPKGIVHCFSGSVEMAREVVSLGMYVGLGGAVTFKNARHPVEVAASVPLTSLVVETDAPYMSPVPFRGKRCDSTMISYTAEKIAQVRSAQGTPITAAEVLEAARENAGSLFGITPEVL